MFSDDKWTLVGNFQPRITDPQFSHMVPARSTWLGTAYTDIGQTGIRGKVQQDSSAWGDTITDCFKVHLQIRSTVEFRGMKADFVSATPLLPSLTIQEEIAARNIRVEAHRMAQLAKDLASLSTKDESSSVKSDPQTSRDVTCINKRCLKGGTKDPDETSELH
eukprot:TRINITY_DN130_c0_g1_i1.p1 TRINITY_DN130_c0_g1~~TRINITY_DN130_c0_g1_i1.p1  ORF type:complete len:163 (+),score=20.31 TRINITY_DN130_c0_g1_i1:127-615(+)